MVLIEAFIFFMVISVFIILISDFFIITILYPYYAANNQPWCEKIEHHSTSYFLLPSPKVSFSKDLCITMYYYVVWFL